MKLVFIGDIHGRDTWKAITTVEPDADHFVFIGDYFDSLDISPVLQLQNIKEIIEFKKANLDRVTLLIGNHDHHYLVKERYSGYNTILQWDANWLLTDNKNLFQIAYQFDNVICSHAGLSPIWLSNILGLWSKHDVIERLNEHYKYRMDDFNFSNEKPYPNPYGDDVTQGPLWIRPNSLMKANKGDDGFKKNYIQIVGHTQQDDIYKSFTHSVKAMGGKYYLIDTLHMGGYLVYEDGIFTPKNI
jgi:hypothetical protein